MFLLLTCFLAFVQSSFFLENFVSIDFIVQHLDLVILPSLLCCNGKYKIIKEIRLLKIQEHKLFRTVHVSFRFLRMAPSNVLYYLRCKSNTSSYKFFHVNTLKLPYINKECKQSGRKII